MKKGAGGPSLHCIFALHNSHGGCPILAFFLQGWAVMPLRNFCRLLCMPS